jgi:hypothetical protein
MKNRGFLPRIEQKGNKAENVRWAPSRFTRFMNNIIDLLACHEGGGREAGEMGVYVSLAVTSTVFPSLKPTYFTYL